MTKVFIDGSYGTTGLRIHQRLQSRRDLELIAIPYEERHSESARRKAYEEADFVFMCLPDAAAKEAVPMAKACHTRVIDASTAHRTADGWVYGFPEISGSTAIAGAPLVANPGCHASGVNALIYPQIRNGILSPAQKFQCFSLTGYSGGGKKMISEYESDHRDALLDAPRMYGLS